MDRLDASRIDLPGIDVRVVARCTSTNSELLDWTGPAPVLLAAEAQTAGRGRRGRRWLSSPGNSITFSLACAVRRAPRELAGLSLVAGVAAARALRDLGAPVTLKWPNDLLIDDAKLGGILVETRPRGNCTCAVIGIGINARCDATLARRVRRRVASLDQHVGDSERNGVIARIGTSLLQALEAFERRGLDPLRPEWERLHAHTGRRLRVRLADGRIVSGLAGGLAADGALNIITRVGVQAVASGQVLTARMP